LDKSGSWLIKGSCKETHLSRHLNILAIVAIPFYQISGEGEGGKCSKNITKKYTYFTISYHPHHVKLVLSSIET
jgi:hypothetical protein